MAGFVEWVGVWAGFVEWVGVWAGCFEWEGVWQGLLSGWVYGQGVLRVGISRRWVRGIDRRPCTHPGTY